MPKNPPDGYHTVTPQIIAESARETLDFVAKVFDEVTHDSYEHVDRAEMAG